MENQSFNNPMQSDHSAVIQPPVQPIFNDGLIASMEPKGKKKKNAAVKIILSFSLGIVVLGVYIAQFFAHQLISFIEVNQKLISIDEQIGTLDTEIEDLSKKRDQARLVYEEKFKEEKAIIDKVLPLGMNKLDLVRLIEDYAAFLENNYGNFEFNSISLLDPVEKDEYMVLPFQTTIKASQANFERLLGLIHLSGNLSTSIPDHIRLMDISQISVRQVGNDKFGNNQGVEVSLRMNAYSRKPSI
ncbi:hypothetical protein IPJ72_05025 [Candidatus Peregrinibacteria bacterium]|nr:MAG: hypothetical protein IPJ72_05025 [Candidatus Peregrinibacteria bacterium]